ncbi:glycosyltransferase family 4 protein [Thermoleophilia bacterium SCSIO 60948]|nr:glycosyltransferase family 4 protein [Thermoleophilia bacterium SCSIO 60948]
MFVGAFGPSKGCLEIVDALAGPHLRRSSSVLRIIGPPESSRAANTIERQALRNGVRDRVEFVPAITDPTQLRTEYMGATVFCLPSHHEASPITVLEAMMMELPVVATPVGGIPELVVDGESAVLVPIGDSGALGAALASLLEAPARRRSLARAARRAAVQAAHPDLIARQWRELYDRFK